jgi:hypothetical protein
MNINKEIEIAVQRKNKPVTFDWSFSSMPNGSYRWQTRHYFRGFLVCDGKEVVLSDGSRSVYKSDVILKNINGKIRKCDRSCYNKELEIMRELVKIYGKR